MTPPKVRLSDFHLSENTYSWGDRSYRVKDLIKASKDLDQFDLPLSGINLGVSPWGQLSAQSFCSHMKRVSEADMSYPVILDCEGYVCDGWHRICKAILHGAATIKAVRLEVMPEPINKDA